MAGTIINNPVVQFFDNNGRLLSGGKITTYLSNTTTPAATWQNEALSTLNTNPIILNSRGEATIWLTPDVQYTFVLTDANDNLIQTVNDVYGSPNIISAASITYDPLSGPPTTVEERLRLHDSQIDDIETTLDLSSLPSANLPVDDVDLFLLRQGNENKKLTASVVRAEFATDAEAAADRAELAEAGAEAAQAQAEAARDAAQLTSGIWPTTAAGIGNGVAGATLSSGGSGGTNGTFALAFTGGTQVLAPAGVFTVVGGTVVSVLITYPGYYSAGAPTFDFSASAGLTGTNIVVIMARNTSVNGYFSVPVVGTENSLILYRVDAGPVATEVTRYPSISTVQQTVGIVNQFGFQSPQNLATPGAALGGTNMFISTTAIQQTGAVTKIEGISQAAGSFVVYILDAPGGIVAGQPYTIARQMTFTVPLGAFSIDFRQLEGFTVTAGQAIGLSGSTVIGRVDASPNPTPYIRGPLTAGTFTATGASSTIALMVSLSLAVNFAEDSILASQVEVNRQDLENQALKVVAGNATITTPNTDLPFREWVLSTPVTDRTVIQRVQLFCRTPGWVEASVWSRSGDTFTKGERLKFPVSPGINDVFLSEQLTVPVGGYIGWSNLLGAIGFTSGGGTVGTYNNVSGSAESFTDATVSTANIQIQFQGYSSAGSAALDVTSESLSQLRTTLTNRGRVKHYLIVWGLGQSNMSGRGLNPNRFTFEAGDAYVYRRASNTLIAMADPTGNDSLSVTNSFSSIGPALSQAVLDATNGTVGVIFINSGEGGTRLSNWGSGQTVWNQAKTDFDQAVALVKAAGYPVIGSCALWMLGETDGDTPSLNQDTYRDGISELAGRVRSHVGLDTRFKFIISTLGLDNGTDPISWPVVRRAQADAARIDAGILIGASNAVTFFSRGLMKDNLHYDTIGLGEIGTALGVAAAAYGIGLRPTQIDLP